MIRLYCKFPDEATAIAVGEALIGREIIPDENGKKSLSVDGWLGGVYWNLDVCFGTGVVYATNEPETKREGYHVNGLWHGPEESLPVALSAFLVHPEHPAVVFG